MKSQSSEKTFTDFYFLREKSSYKRRQEGEGREEKEDKKKKTRRSRNTSRGRKNTNDSIAHPAFFCLYISVPILLFNLHRDSVV